MTFRTRIAPTPSGSLHLGNLFNFILTWWFVRKSDGELYLRIDDFDSGRTRDEYIENIFRWLDKLELDIDHGPKDILEFKREYSQTLKFDYYFRELQKREDIFNCNCSRKDLIEFDSYPKNCNHKKLEFIPFETSIRMNSIEDNIILWRKDNIPAYHWVSFIEDRDMRITHLVRGEDLRSSSQVQSMLAGSEHFPKADHIFHHSLVLKSNGEKLSKSKNDILLEETTALEVFHHFSEHFNKPAFKSLKELLKIDLSNCFNR